MTEYEHAHLIVFIPNFQNIYWEMNINDVVKARHKRTEPAD